jgi:hypothetical protein
MSPVRFYNVDRSKVSNPTRSHHYLLLRQLVELTVAAPSSYNIAVPDFAAAIGDKAREYAIKDAMIAATHATLAAESLGLSSTPVKVTSVLWKQQGVKTEYNLA